MANRLSVSMLALPTASAGSLCNASLLHQLFVRTIHASATQFVRDKGARAREISAALRDLRRATDQPQQAPGAHSDQTGMRGEARFGPDPQSASLRPVESMSMLTPGQAEWEAAFRDGGQGGPAAGARRSRTREGRREDAASTQIPAQDDAQFLDSDDEAEAAADDAEEEDEEAEMGHALATASQPGMMTVEEPALCRERAGPGAYVARDIIAYRRGLPWVALPHVALTLPVPMSGLGPLSVAPQSQNPWAWAMYTSSGSLFGARVHTVVLAPLNAALEAHHSRADRSAPFLPVRLTVRVYTGIASGPLGRSARGEEIESEGETGAGVPHHDWSSLSLALGRALTDLHILRHGPAGELIGRGGGSRRPKVLHSWRDPASLTEAAGQGLGLGRPYTLGLEYETLCDEHLHASVLPAQDASGALASALAQHAGGEPDLCATRLFTQRHAVSFTLQPPQARVGAPPLPDCLHEVTLSAPASLWDCLWQGEQEDDPARLLAGGVALEGLVPSAREMGLEGLGLKCMFENATITGNDAQEEEGRPAPNENDKNLSCQTLGPKSADSRD